MTLLLVIAQIVWWAAAAAGTACALVLVELRRRRPAAPVADPIAAPATVWPGDPEGAWTAASARPLRRGAPPSFTDLASFRRVAAAPQSRFAALGAIAVVSGVLVAVHRALGAAPSGGWELAHAALTWVIVAVCLVLGPIVWSPRRRRRWQRDQYQRVREFGVLCEVHGPSIEIETGEHSRTALVFIAVDAPDDRAARIVDACRLWAERIEGLRSAAVFDADRRVLGRAWGDRDAVRTQDLFGPDAEGGFLVESDRSAGGFAVLIPMIARSGDPTPFRYVEQVPFRRSDASGRRAAAGGGTAR